MSDRNPAAFLEFAAAVGPRIEEALDGYTDYGEGCPSRLRDAIRHSLLAPGKRLRPLLVLSAADACGCPLQRAMPAACAVEMVHTYSLIHDDLPAMDDDDLRRGRPSCHAAFDEATAILAGDALLAQAFEILGAEIRPASSAAGCCVELARAAGATQMVGGQADDLAAEREPGDLAKLESIHHRKTGAMLVASLRLGGIIAEATDEPMRHLSAYGSSLGLAFQITDDLLDQTGNTSEMGKRTGQDSSHGKLTFPALLGLEESRRRAKAAVDEAIGCLDYFGQRAAHLEALARFVLERNR